MGQLIYKKEDLEHLRNKLKEIKNIKSVKIATAFISNTQEVKELLKNISNNVKSKENFEIYLSPEFSATNKAEILTDLRNISNVYIIHNLHAKAYYIDGEEEIFVFGSSNLTDNGFSNNLELIKVEKNIDKIEIQQFFDYCKANARLVTEKVRTLKSLYDLLICR